MNNFSRGQRRSFVVTRTARSRHTFATVIHVGSIYAGTAINWHELDAACDIRLTESTAGGLTGIDIVGVLQGLRTQGGVFCLRARR